MIAGGWPVKGKHRRQIEVLAGRKLNLKQYTYFVAACALNHQEMNQENG